MGTLTTLFSSVLPVIVSLIAIIAVYFKWSFQYWKRKNIPFLKPLVPWGNVPSPFDKNTSDADNMRQLYNDMKSKKLKYCGVYVVTKPAFLVKDLEYIKSVLLKDFDYFVDRYFYVNEKDDPIGAHLFALGGERWKSLRVKLTPTFTSGKMKSMFPILVDVGMVMETFLNKILEKNEPINIKNVSSCYTTDIIGSCAFGLDCNSFKEPDSLFRKHGNKIFNFSLIRQLHLTIGFGAPNLARTLGFRQIEKDTSDFYYKIVRDSVSYREANNVVRKDFLQLLIELKNENIINMDELVAQCFIFFAAGFETSSTTMTFTLFELAKNPHIQDKLREEIKNVLNKHDGQITYDAITDMKYMDQIISETLRKYPPLPFITRSTVKDYKVPGESVVIEKDTFTIIPIIGIHYDEDYYENPSEYIPERFSPENKGKIPQFAYMPFGEGPRLCIGMRFGLMQTKVGLTCLLRKFKFLLNEKTKLPIKMSPSSFTLSIEGDLWLNVEKV